MDIKLTFKQSLIVKWFIETGETNVTYDDINPYFGWLTEKSFYKIMSILDKRNVMMRVSEEKTRNGKVGYRLMYETYDINIRKMIPTNFIYTN
jgi:hypothetical protein